MKKLMIWLTTALLVMILCFAALANGNDKAAELYDSVADLLFFTDNVTLTGTAEFTLDGEWFKTAEGTWKQDGSRSFRQLLLSSPKWDGTKRKNGYTLVAEGMNEAGTEYSKISVMEVFQPGVYRTGTTDSRKSILRRTVETEQLIRLGRALFSQADLLLGEGAVTKTEDGAFRLELGENAPYIVNTALNQFARFAAKRYFEIDYDDIKMDSYTSFYNHTTLTQGILYTMRNLTLKKASVTLKTDENNAPLHIEGQISMEVETAADGVKQLDITFTADVSDRGTTMVKRFDPADYDVVPAEEFTGETVRDIRAMEPYRGATLDAEAADLNEFETLALDTLSGMGCDRYTVTAVGCYALTDGYAVRVDSMDGWIRQFFITADKKVTGIQTAPAEWLEADMSQYNYEPAPDTGLETQARSFLTDFLKTVSPEKSAEELNMTWTYEANGSVYAQYDGYLQDPNGDGVTIVMKLSPEMSIDFYSCISNG